MAIMSLQRCSTRPCCSSCWCTASPASVKEARLRGGGAATGRLCSGAVARGALLRGGSASATPVQHDPPAPAQGDRRSSSGSRFRQVLLHHRMGSESCLLGSLEFVDFSIAPLRSIYLLLRLQRKTRSLSEVGVLSDRELLGDGVQCWNGGVGASGEGDEIATTTIMLDDTCTRGC